MAKKTPFPIYLTLHEDKTKHESFIRLPATIMNSKTVRKLNPLPYKIFTYMLLDSQGKPEFKFPHNSYKHIASKGGFHNAINELQKAGLIDIVSRNQNIRQPNEYRFSCRWKENEK